MSALSDAAATARTGLGTSARSRSSFVMPTRLPRGTTPRGTAPAPPTTQPKSNSTFVMPKTLPRSPQPKPTGEKKEKPRSLWEQAEDIGKSIPYGVGQLAWQAGKTVAAPVFVAGDVIRTVAEGDDANNALYNAAKDGFDWSDLGDITKEYLPLGSNMQTSLRATGNRIGNPTQYMQAIDEGRILETIAEDVGNLSLVAGPTAKALGTTAATAALPVRTAAFLEATGAAERTATRSLGAAVAEAAPAAGAATSEFTARQIARALRENLGPAPTVLDDAGRTVPLTRNVQMRGTGLAGAAERAGLQRTARGLQATGSGVRQVGKLGEAIDNAQVAWPAKLVTKPLAFGARKIGLPEYVKAAATRAAQSEGVIGKVARTATPQGRAAADVHRTLQAENTSAYRNSLTAERVGEQLDLGPAQRRLTLNVADARFVDMADQYNANPDTFEANPNEMTGVEGFSRFDTVLEQQIDEMFGDMDEKNRPTAEDVRLYADYRADRLAPDTADKVRTVVEAQSEISERRTNEQVRQGRLAEEQLNDEMRPSVIAKEQERRAGKAEEWRHQWEGEHTKALHLERMANARIAINDAIPKAPDIKASIDAGVSAGWKMADMEHLEAAVDAASAELEVLVDQYVDLTEGDVDSPQLKAAAQQVDRATKRVEDLKTRIRTQARQADAMKGLETATGEVEVAAGGESVLDLEGGGAAQARQQVMEGAEPVLDKPSVKAAVDEAHDTAKREVLDEKAQFGGVYENGPHLLTNKQREAVSSGHETTKTGKIKPGTGNLAGEYDHWVFQPDGKLTREQRLLRNRYIKLGYLQKALESTTSRVAPDVWANAVHEANPHLAGTDPVTTLEQYLEIADREMALDDARNGVPSREILERAADSLDADPALLADALGETTKEGFRAALLRDTDAALTDLHARYNDLSPDQQASLMSDLNEMLVKEPDAYDAMDVLDAFNTAMPGSTRRHDIFERLANGGIRPQDIIEFMQSTDSVVTEKFYRAVTAPPSMAQYRQQAATAAELQRNKGRLSEAVLHQRAAMKNVTVAEYADETNVNRMAMDVNDAAAALEQVEGEALDSMVEAVNARKAMEDIAAAGTYEEVVVDKDGNERTVVRQPHKSTPGRNAAGEVTHPKTPYQRALVNEGVMRNQAGQAATKAARSRRYMTGWLDKLADVRSDLAKRWQDRIVDEVNRPAVGGMRRTIRSIAPEVGQYIEPLWNQDGSLLADARINGFSGRLATRFGFMDELVGKYEEMQADLRRGQRLSAVDKADAFYSAAEEAGVVFDDLTTSQFDDSWQTDDLLEQINALELNAQMQGTRLNAPRRIIDLIQQQDWIDNKVGRGHTTRHNMPHDIGSTLQRQADAYFRRQGSFINRFMDQQTRAAPGKWRAPMLNARRNVATLVKMAEDYNQANPGSGDVFLRIAEDSATTLSEMIDKGIEPVHLIGGKVIERPGGAGAAPLSTGKRMGLATRKTMAEYELRTGLRPMDPSVYARTEAHEMITLLHNNAAELVNDKFGTTVESVIGDQIAEHKRITGRPMPALKMQELIEDAGYGGKIENEGSTVVPKIVLNELDNWSNNKDGAFLNYLTKANRVFKTSVLPFSARWHVGNIIGNALMSTVYGGVGPVELANTLRKVAKSEGGWKEYYRNQGIPAWAPEHLADHGLSYGEHQMLWNGMTVPEAATTLQRMIAGSFNVNQFFDNMFRSAVYVSQVKKNVLSGVDNAVESATKRSLNAMGDYSKMTSFERRYVRQVFPFYAWIRHQTVAALRLPITSPTRAAWLYSLANVYGDEEMTPEMMALMGARIPMFGGALNLGSISPFGNPLELPLDPTSSEFGRGVTVGISLPAKAVLGVDLDKMRAITRPADTADTGIFGEALTTPPLARILDAPMETAYTVAGELPYIRSLRDVAMPGSRYNTGQLRPTQYPTRKKSVDEKVMSLLNLPSFQQNIQDELDRVNQTGSTKKKAPRLMPVGATPPKPGG